jgi:hypothetical protein
MSALHKIKLKKHTNPMKILTDISAVKIRYMKTLDEERKIEIVQSCEGDNYAQVIVIEKLCKAMQKLWQITGHNGKSLVTMMTKKKTMTMMMTANSLKHCWVQ